MYVHTSSYQHRHHKHQGVLLHTQLAVTQYTSLYHYQAVTHTVGLLHSTTTSVLHMYPLFWGVLVHSQRIVTHVYLAQMSTLHCKHFAH